MSMAILAIGHGSEMAVKKCSSSDVRVGVIFGNVPPVGWYCFFLVQRLIALAAGGLVLLLVCCCFFALLRLRSGCHMHLMDDLPCLSTRP